MTDEPQDPTSPPRGQRNDRDLVRLEPVHTYATDLDLEIVALRARITALGIALKQAGEGIEDTLFENAFRDLPQQARLAAAVQRNALAAGAMIADLLHVSGQLAGITSAVHEVAS